MPRKVTFAGLALAVVIVAACSGGVSLGVVPTTDAGDGHDVAPPPDAVAESPPADAASDDAAPERDAPVVTAFPCARSFGGSGDGLIRQVAVDSQANVLVVGSFYGTYDFGMGPVSSAGDADAFVAKLSPKCEPIWVKRFGDSLAQFGSAVTVGSADDVYVALGGPGSIDFGAGPLPPAPAADVYLAKYDKDGHLVFANHYGDTVHTYHIDVIEWLVHDPSSDTVAMTGYFADDIDFGNGTLHGRVGALSIFAAKLGADGAPVWSKAFGEQGDGATTSNAFSYGGALLPNGDLVITGTFSGDLNLGGPNLSGQMFIGALAAGTGAHRWSRAFANASATAVAASATGDLVVTGSVFGATDFGTGTVTPQGNDALVLALAADGTTRWAKALGDAADQAGISAIALPSGDLLVAGHMAGTVDFGGGPQTSAGGNDIFLARYHGDGTFRHATLLGDPADQVYPFVAPTASDLIAVGGRFYGTIDAGGTSLVNGGSTQDLFVWQTAP